MNAYAVFLFRPLKFSRLVCVLAKTFTMFFSDFFFCLKFRQLRFIGKMWTTFSLIFLTKKEKHRSDFGIGVYKMCAKFQALPLKNSLDILDFCA